MMRRQTRKDAGDATIGYRSAIAGLGLLGLALTGCNTSSVLDAGGGPTPGSGLTNTPVQQSAAQSAGADAAGMAAGQEPAALAPDGQADSAALAARPEASSDTRVQFAPIIGATAEATPALSNRLQARARQRGIAIVERTDSASLILKGYFSAIADGGKTTVVYVWDVLDPSGTRLHRIQGQEAAPGGSGDGWSSVTDATMEAVADATMRDLSAWLEQRQG